MIELEIKYFTTAFGRHENKYCCVSVPEHVLEEDDREQVFSLGRIVSENEGIPFEDIKVLQIRKI